VKQAAESKKEKRKLAKKKHTLKVKLKKEQEQQRQRDETPMAASIEEAVAFRLCAFGTLEEV
jgi:hypothetical protein